MGRIRFRLGVLLFAFAASVALAGEELLNFVPAGTEYVIGVDAESLRSLSCFKKLTESDSEAGEWLQEFEHDYNLRFSDCADLLFVGGGSRLRGLLAKISVQEADLARRLRNFGPRYSLEGEAGRRLHCVRADHAAVGSMTVGVAYMAPSIVLATERKYVAPFLSSLSVPDEKRRKILIVPDGEPLAWSFINLKSILSKSGKRSSGGPFLKGVNSVFVELNTMGDGEFWRLDAVARCDDEKSAQQFALMAPAYLQLGASLIFSDDPVLGREFLRKVKFMPEGRRVLLELAMDRLFAERLVRYLGEQAKKRMIPPDPIPGDIRTQQPEGVGD